MLLKQSDTHVFHAHHLSETMVSDPKLLPSFIKVGVLQHPKVNKAHNLHTDHMMYNIQCCRGLLLLYCGSSDIFNQHDAQLSGHDRIYCIRSNMTIAHGANLTRGSVHEGLHQLQNSFVADVVETFYY